MATYAIPLAALILAAAGFIGSTWLSARTYARSASSEWVHSLEARLEVQRKELEECRADRARLHGEVDRLSEREVLLMRRVMALEEEGH